jgi:hypothetical protein
MRTTISINDAILRSLRKAAAESGVTLRRAVNEALLMGLHREQPSRFRPSRKRFVVAPHDLQTKEAYRTFRAHELYDQLEAEQDRA